MLITGIKKQKYIYPTLEDRKKTVKNTGLYYKMNELNLLVKESGILEIKENYDVYCKYADGVKCVWSIKLVTRRHQSIAKYWLLLKALEFHFSKSEVDGKSYEMTAEMYNLYFKRKYLGMDKEYNPLTNNYDYYDKHVSYSDMPEESDFMIYFSRVTEEINTLGYDVNELIESMGV
jgi:hypothetical protein